jgi:hypothetical protein
LQKKVLESHLLSADPLPANGDRLDPSGADQLRLTPLTHFSILLSPGNRMAQDSKYTATKMI